ncbi:MAG: hydrogenase iron-sulfur subunit [Bacteroidales bacterium]|nr:hydrogenase iron-sulfur subunit [Bacteroidales bacterium]
MSDYQPRILVFSSEKISDPAIDLAGLLKKHYSPRVYNITLPCTSAVKPNWILKALHKGMDGVFIASDGTDCAFRSDCSALTNNSISKAQQVMKEEGIDLARVKMAALCSVCADPFVGHMKSFSETLSGLGSIKNETGQKDG